MQLKDIRKLFLGLNKDLDPSLLQNGEFVDGLNIRVASSDQQQGIGPAETMQSEIELLINVSAPIYYGGSAIGGDFIYSGYEEVVIGTQTWLKRNWDANYPGSKVYNNDEGNRAIYGGLYTYNQIIESDFCPPGWHVPTEAEANVLLSYLGGALIAGGKMKEPSTSHWLTPNTGADDSSGFKGLPGGKMDAIFSLLAERGLFWILGEGYPWAPVALPATDITPLTFMAHWEASDGATGYFLDVATDAAFTSFVAGFNNLGVGNVLQAMVSGLSPTITYYYRLRAYNEIDTSDNSNVITVLTSAVIQPLLDIDANVYTTVIIGNQEWITKNYEVTHYADGSPIPNITEDEYDDWFLPSGDELIAISTELHSHGIGGFADAWYWSSSEDNAFDAYRVLMTDGSFLSTQKDNSYNICAIRSFISSNVYALRSIGPAGGYIFNITDNGDGTFTYLESEPTGGLPVHVWSNVIGFAIGTTGFAIGTGQANTTLIISQPGHVDSAAKHCDDLLAGGWIHNTLGAYCWYDNDIINKTPYGAIYNWHAVDNAHVLPYLERGGVQEIGWRMPMIADFLILRNYLGGELVAGGKLKETGTTHWLAPNGGATNESGFTAVPAGYRDATTGGFVHIFRQAHFWLNPEVDPSDAPIISLWHFGAEANYNPAVLKEYGHSVRLVRDVAGVGGVTWDSTLITFDSTLITFDAT